MKATVTAPTMQQSGPTTTSTRKTAVLVRLLFLTATVTFLIADALIIGVLDRPDYLTGASADATALTTGALLAFVDGIAIVGITVLLFPLLKRHSEPLPWHSTSVSESPNLRRSYSTWRRHSW